MKHVTFLIDGRQQDVYGEYAAGEGFISGWMQDPAEPVLGYGQGPFLADIALLDLSAPLTTTPADPNSCAALYPSATYAVRLLFASAVYERAADGNLVPFNTDAAAAAALFSVRDGEFGDETSPDGVVGVAVTPGGSVVDVCIQAAGREPQVEAVAIDCTPTAPLSPAGYSCGSPVMAFLRSWADQEAGRDPATFAAGHTIEFCLADADECPGAAPADYIHTYEFGDGHDYATGRRDSTRALPGGMSSPSFVAGAGLAMAVLAVLTSLGVAGYVKLLLESREHAGAYKTVTKC